jgi:hypothetical protein
MRDLMMIVFRVTHESVKLGRADMSPAFLVFEFGVEFELGYDPGLLWNQNPDLPDPSLNLTSF